ncbi:MAG: dTDP-4-dehydrorhamnose 3,5-epimerase family protein [Pelagibacterales bacterium]|nr:dTDP-4-dehydrorhamnose 3,5-epimerase family protein [Pelagibacterales bacterium]
MDLEIENRELGVQILTPKINNDDRGFVSEIFRNDWDEFFGNDKPKQINISKSHPGIIRAWHRHLRNQVDYFTVLKGTMKICIADNNKESKTFGKLVEIIASEDKLQIIKVPGNFWHGTKTMGKVPSFTVYFINNMYDYQDPDEERIQWDDPSIIDPRTKLPYDWNSVN